MKNVEDGIKKAWLAIGGWANPTIFVHGSESSSTGEDIDWPIDKHVEVAMQSWGKDEQVVKSEPTSTGACMICHGKDCIRF
jgi:hypothetical protein